MSNTIAWMWQHPDGAFTIRAMFASTAISWAGGSNMTQQTGFPVDRRDNTIAYLEADTRQREAEGCQLVRKPKTFDLGGEAISEIILGSGSQFRPTPNLVSQLWEQLQLSPPEGYKLLQESLPRLSWASPEVPVRGVTAGDIYFDTSMKISKVWNGTSWVPLEMRKL